MYSNHLQWLSSKIGKYLKQYYAKITAVEFCTSNWIAKVLTDTRDSSIIV